MRRVVLLPLMLLAGCGGDQRQEAVDAATDWLRAVGERDAERACDLMAESATDALRKKLDLNPRTTCLGALRAHADGFDRGEIDSVLEIGLEAEGPVKEGELGVFPVSGPRELQVILMRRDGDRWKVASTTLMPDAPPAPSS